MKSKLLLIPFLIFSIQCYLNPILQKELNSNESKNNPNLGLLIFALPRSTAANTDATLQVVGQIKNLSSQSISSPILKVASIASSTRVAVSDSVTGNSSGKFLMKLRSGTVTISVSDSSGTNLGSFILNIVSQNSITTTTVSGANFSVTGITAYGINETVTLTEDPVPTYTIGGMVNTACFVTDCNGGGQFTITNLVNSDSLVVVAGAPPQDGKFTMPTALVSGTSYNLSVTANAPAYTCSVAANGSGNVGSSNVTNVSVTCTLN
jgi:hypothetical protein